MIDHASKHLDPALTPQILLKAANLIKGIVWVSDPIAASPPHVLQQPSV